jgi:hypothetical protein
MIYFWLLKGGLTHASASFISCRKNLGHHHPLIDTKNRDRKIHRQKRKTGLQLRSIIISPIFSCSSIYVFIAVIMMVALVVILLLFLFLL